MRLREDNVSGPTLAAPTGGGGRGEVKGATRGFFFFFYH